MIIKFDDIITFVHYNLICHSALIYTICNEYSFKKLNYDLEISKKTFKKKQILYISIKNIYSYAIL